MPETAGMRVWSLSELNFREKDSRLKYKIGFIHERIIQGCIFQMLSLP